MSKTGDFMENSAQLDPRVEEEQTEIERLKEELHREHEMYVRVLADFDNYRRRVERDRAKAAQAGKKDLLLSLLAVIDNFERAFEHLDEAPESISTGLRVIHKQMLGLLESEGITPFESKGERFDPTRHEAIGTVEDENLEPGTVFDELQRGYLWGKELFRPARVRVVK
jgi:molecular chaperone GrpE